MHVAQLKLRRAAPDQPQLRVRIVTAALDPLAKVHIAAVHRVAGKLRRAARFHQRLDARCQLRADLFIGVEREDPVAGGFFQRRIFLPRKPFPRLHKDLRPNLPAPGLTVLSVLPESTTTISSAISFTLWSVRTMFASSLRVMMQTERVMRRRIAGVRGAGHPPAGAPVKWRNVRLKLMNYRDQENFLRGSRIWGAVVCLGFLAVAVAVRLAAGGRWHPAANHRLHACRDCRCRPHVLHAGLPASERDARRRSAAGRSMSAGASSPPCCCWAWSWPPPMAAGFSS